jgi:hypothetical protein
MKNLFLKLDWPAVFLSFCICMAFVYVFGAQNRTVNVVWPNPSRAPVTAYEKDDGPGCYAYKAKKVSCHKDKQ